MPGLLGLSLTFSLVFFSHLYFVAGMINITHQVEPRKSWSAFKLEQRKKTVSSNAAVDSRLRTGLYAERVTHSSRFSGTKISESAYTQGAICALVGIAKCPVSFRESRSTIKTEDPLFSIENNAAVSARTAGNINHERILSRARRVSRSFYSHVWHSLNLNFK